MCWLLYLVFDACVVLLGALCCGVFEWWVLLVFVSWLMFVCVIGCRLVCVVDRFRLVGWLLVWFAVGFTCLWYTLWV